MNNNDLLILLKSWALAFMWMPTCRRPPPPSNPVTSQAQGTWQRTQGVDLAPKFYTSQSDWASAGCPTSQIHQGPSSQPTGPKGSSTWSQTAHNILRGLGMWWLDRTEQLWWQEGDLHNIRKVVLMLWLVSGWQGEVCGCANNTYCACLIIHITR